MSTIPFTPRANQQHDDEVTLTSRQRDVLDAIRDHVEQRGFAPSFREIGTAVGLKSPSSVKHQLQVLEEKGFIRISANKGRAIELLDQANRRPSRTGSFQSTYSDANISRIPVTVVFGKEDDEEMAQFHDIPLVGRIAAGAPITAEQHVDDVMRLPERLTGNGNLFMLEVHGDSMVDAAICDGDFVVVREQQTAVNGEIVAALLDGEATVKTFRKEKGHVWLIPHNPAYSPIDGNNATIMGKVVTVLRKL
ncbi:LexA family transcriptional regulator [Bifidobacterium margollesii]|uniref:LexA repressor n=1 Tax=Bifidobacterium margollesii TaxID=2020964 RepID=A0A2N5JBK1_9BIFI|nr:transcriptional repressor LexA [Bifidobacterium margollesii]PLS31587.1 LexA family transcriptional regulator [Bifidobacterium margollesii]